MNKVLSIALLSFRSAIRSKLVIMLIGLLALAVIGLPLTIKDNGTIAGRIQIILNYTLSTISVLLAIVSVWWGCAGISREVTDKQIHMILAKPVSRTQVWLGKWLGLVSINASLLLISSLGVYGLLMYKLRPQIHNQIENTEIQNEVLVSRYYLAPEAENLEPQVRDRYLQMKEAKQLNSAAPASFEMDNIRKAIKIQANMINPGFKRAWNFQLPSPPPKDKPILLKYKFASANNLQKPIQGLWLFNDEEQQGRYQAPVVHVAGASLNVEIPYGAIGEDLSLSVAYANLDGGAPLLFDPSNGLRLMYYSDSFELNLLRAILILLAQLVFFSAIGVTMGSLFSFPVATFTAGSIILMQQFSNFIQTRAEDASTSLLAPTKMDYHLWDEITDRFYQGLNLLVQPLKDTPVFSDLASGIMIPWSTVATIWFVKLIIYSGILLVVGSYFFNRREIGLPD